MGQAGRVPTQRSAGRLRLPATFRGIIIAGSGGRLDARRNGAQSYGTPVAEPAPARDHLGPMTSERGMHLTLSLAGHGFHPAAWRVSTLSDGPGLLPDYRGLVAQAEAATLDAVWFVPSPLPAAALAAGGLEAVMPDPLPRLASLIGHCRRIGLGGSVYLGHTE